MQVAEKEQEVQRSDTKTTCGTWAVVSECARGIHKYAKRIYCGREWCKVCGQHRSAAHNRRISRILPKVLQIKTMGYFVIEFPDKYRKLGAGGINQDEILGAAWCYSKKDLQDTTNRLVKVMAGKRTASKRRCGGYFKRGLVRWHWFGDKVPGKWNPHVNILVDGAYIGKGLLEKIKANLRRELCCPDLIVNYSYCDKPGQMFHRAEYITRATFLNYDWSPYMANELYNFRNQRWWGSWKDEPAWDVEKAENDAAELLKVSQLQKGCCPECNDGTRLKVFRIGTQGKPVTWTGPIDSTWLIIWGAEEMSDTGYYRIGNKEWMDWGIGPPNISIHQNSGSGSRYY